MATSQRPFAETAKSCILWLRPQSKTTSPLRSYWHRFRSVARDPTTKVCPSGAQAQLLAGSRNRGIVHFIDWVCFKCQQSIGIVTFANLTATSHNRAFLSRAHVTIMESSGLHAKDPTPPSWSERPPIT